MIFPKAPRPAASGGLRRSAAAGMTKARCRVILGALLTQAEAAPMPTVQPFPAGGYRFISHQFQYSGGVAAEPGFRIERARFARSLPLADGFDAIEAYLAGIGRSPTAFCASELRSPAQFTDAGFVAFNRHYVDGWPSGGSSARRSTRLPARTCARKSTRPPRRRSTPSAIRCRAKAARRAALSLPEAAQRARAAPAMRGASSGPATTHPRRMRE